MLDSKKENIIENTKNFTPYGTDPEKDKMVKSNYYGDRLKMAEEGYGLNVLINDEDCYVRIAVVNQGYGLDVLINDKDYYVRRAVAYQGYGLAILINDEDWIVREAVVNQGYGLDVLINDKDYDIRKAVLNYLKDNNLTLAEWCNQNNKEIDLKNLAHSPYPEARVAAIKSGYVYEENEIYIAPDCKFTLYGTGPEKNKMINSSDYGKRLKMAYQGYGLGILVNDEDYNVRAAVVEQGYGLNILINDEDCDIVRKAVLNYLKDNNLTLAEWCNQNNKEIDLKNLAYSPYPEARVAAIESGYVYKESEMYIAPDCKFIPYGTDSEKDKMVKSDNWRDRLEMAKQGYGLNILINDKYWDVRAAVAEQGYGLNILVNDKYAYVRETVADQGYGLDVLINDEDCDVRIAVVNQGYGLNILINDEDYDVRIAVLNYLKDNNLTLAEWCNQNNKEIDLKNLAYSPYPEARVAAIESGYVYKESEMYIAPDCKFTPYGTDPEKDKMVKSDYVKDRLKMAEEGYDLDVLDVGDYWSDRLKMAEEGYGLDILINDESGKVREAVAYQGYGLGILVNDEYWKVRAAVADQGYGLDVLINDEARSVRHAVEDYLTSHNLTLEQWKSNQEHSKANIINQAKNAINKGKIYIKNVANNIRSTDNILNTNINKIDEINEISESNNINK